MYHAKPRARPLIRPHRTRTNYAVFVFFQDISGIKNALFDNWFLYRSMSGMTSVLTPALCKAARMMLGWTQHDLAAKSGVTVRTVARFEGGLDERSAKARDAFYRAFVECDIQFIAANGETPELDGVGLRWKPRLPHSGIKIL